MGIPEVLETIDIQELIPQRPPFVMVDALTHFDRTVTRTRTLVREENLFAEAGVLTEPGVIENIAQTCAVRMGFINTYIVQDTVKLGFIGAIKNLVIERLPRVGEQMVTTIEVASEVFSLTLVNAKTEIGGEVIASCEMKISVTDIESNG